MTFGHVLCGSVAIFLVVPFVIAADPHQCFAHRQNEVQERMRAQHGVEERHVEGNDYLTPAYAFEDGTAPPHGYRS